MKRQALMGPWRDFMAPEKWYRRLDPGIRFAVRVLHSACIETCQSCQGGKGHAYPEPSVDIVAAGSDAKGFEALSALHDYGLPVSTVEIVWNIRHGLPYEKIWRVTFTRPFPERADQKAIFKHGYRAV